MKKTIQLLILVISFTSMAQEIKLDDLKTPNSPGFQILDITPSTIDRPTNPKEFTASLLSLTSNGSAIPKNFAMELAPYWYFKPKKANVYNYLNIEEDNRSNNFSGILNKLSISLASTFSDSTSGSLLKNTNYIAFGIRTNLFTYRTPKQNEMLKKSLDSITTRIGELRSHKEEKNKLKGLIVKYSADLINETDPDKKSIIQSKLTIVENQIDQIDDASSEELEKSIEKDEIAQRNLKKVEELPLFQLDAAFAYSEAIPDNEYDNKRFNRSGFWLNAALNAFSINKEELNDNLSLIVSVRFISDNLLEENTTDVFKRNTAIDHGFKIEYSIKQFSIGVEYLKRKYSDNSDLDSERTVGVLQYKISDGIYFTGSYGKNFGDVKNLFTLFGINYGFGTSKLNPNSK